MNVFFGIFSGSFLSSSLYPTGTEIPDKVSIMRINADNTQTDWTGHYESVEDALADIQRNYE